jgi:hypothetical protein
MAGTKQNVYSQDALVAQTISGANELTSLEGIEVSGLPDRTTCFVNNATGSQLFRWFDDSVAVPDGATVVLPLQLTLADPGRWILQTGGGGGGGTITGGANVGGGPGQVFQNAAGATLNFRTIASPDASVTVTTVGSQVQLTVAGGGGSTVGDFTGDKGLSVAAPVAGDQATTLLTISNTPANNGLATQRGYVVVQVNGVSVRLGGTTVAPSECYFSSAGPGVAKALDDIAAGDTLYWNSSVVGYGLAPTDRLDFLYSIT